MYRPATEICERLSATRGCLGGAKQAHLEDSRMCEASREKASLAQQALYERANVQGIGLVVANQQQGAVQGDPPATLLHPPILCSG